MTKNLKSVLGENNCLVHHYECLDEDKNVAEAITSGKAVAISNGSFNPDL